MYTERGNIDGLPEDGIRFIGDMHVLSRTCRCVDFSWPSSWLEVFEYVFPIATDSNCSMKSPGHHPRDVLSPDRDEREVS